MLWAACLSNCGVQLCSGVEIRKIPGHHHSKLVPVLQRFLGTRGSVIPNARNEPRDSASVERPLLLMRLADLTSRRYTHWIIDTWLKPLVANFMNNANW